jgi:hypothetical protein
VIFFLTGIPPLFTAIVGWRNIDEPKTPGQPVSGQSTARPRISDLMRVRTRGPGLIRFVRSWSRQFGALRRRHRTIWLTVLFVFFWKFSPSIGYIERSYLIDERGFSALSFGVILSAGSVIFLASILTYRWVVARFPEVGWHHYLYAMIALGVLSFPLSFFLYLAPDHPWWRYVYFTLPDWLNPLPAWNRYQWFRLITQSVLGFATIPAFMIPLTIMGETVELKHAGMGYAFLTSLSNVTVVFEGVIGAGLYDLFGKPWMAWLVEGFRGSVMNFARSADERTLILEIFVYISLAFTLLAIPFIELLRRELDRRAITIRLGGSPPEATT